MLSFLASLILAQNTPTPPPQQEIVQPQEVRPLPGELNSIPLFNSNSPEVVLTEGILLSTFPSENKVHAEAHLDYAFQGRFNIFTHHIARAEDPEDPRTLYMGILLHNPTTEPATVDVFSAASYLSQPDAPFIRLPSQVPNPRGDVYSGPGSRVMSDIIRDRRSETFPSQLVIPPGESRMLLNIPIPVEGLEPPLNGRSTYVELRTDSPIYVASLAKFTEDGNKPSLEQWEQILQTGDVAKPRDRAPTPPDSTTGSFIYGRVAGVSKGTEWNARLTSPNEDFLRLPDPGEPISYAISTLQRGMLGTGQVQSAPMLVRYPDTAYFAHGNYGLEYNLNLPLYNPTNETKTVTLSLQTPIKQDELDGGLRFLQPPAPQVFFRGTVQLKYRDDAGIPRTRYYHLVQQRGQMGEPLVTLNIEPQQHRFVSVNFLYPPDATPPQVLTVRTLDPSQR